MKRVPLVAVIGNGSLPAGDSRWAVAERIGRMIVDEGYRLLTGGLGGVMRAAALGARASSSYREGAIVAVPRARILTMRTTSRTSCSLRASMWDATSCLLTRTPSSPSAAAPAP